MFTTLIEPGELAQLPHAAVFDCRARLGDPAWGRRAFLDGHIAGARHADLDLHLAAAPGDGGRHPLPASDDWIAQIRRWGVKNADQVVVYDDAGGAFAARAWWLFRWVGHRAVAVLNGGLDHWHGAREPGDAAVARASDFAPRPALTRTVNPGDIRADAPFRLVDARSLVRFRGEQEPIDAVAGHIPGAVCLPFQENLCTDGTFKTAVALRARFADVDDPIVCYCGSGVTAAHNVLALTIAGREEPYLYPGSWSEWIRDPTRPIATC